MNLAKFFIDCFAFFGLATDRKRALGAWRILKDRRQKQAAGEELKAEDRELKTAAPM